MPILGLITTILSKNEVKNTKNSLFFLTFGGVPYLQPNFNHFSITFQSIWGTFDWGTYPVTSVFCYAKFGLS